VARAAAAVFRLDALGQRGYFWLVVLLTSAVLLMISADDFEGDTVALDRRADTMVDIVIGPGLRRRTRPTLPVRGASREAGPVEAAAKRTTRRSWY
jgi:hypothetical protein